VHATEQDGIPGQRTIDRLTQKKLDRRRLAWESLIMTNANRKALNHLARLAEKALLASDADLYVDLQAQMAAIFEAARR
jgi:hypothetical protein